MRHQLLWIIALSLVIGIFAAGSDNRAQARFQSDATPISASAALPSGLIVIASPFPVSETVDRLEVLLEENELLIVARIDHAANAAGAEMDLRPTQLVIFGNPKAGTTLMQGNQTIGIDLPQKFLAWEDAEGQTYLAYNDPAYLAQRHGLDVQDAGIQQIANALATLARDATTP